MSESRKATDVLLSVEQKIEKLIRLLESKDLSDKIISNKLNNVIALLSVEKNNSSSAPTFTAEAVNVTQPPTIKVSPEDTLQIKDAPSSNGFSRTSRPETFAGDNSYLKKATNKDSSPRMPVQVPKGNHVEIVVPQDAVDLNKLSPTKETISATKNNTGSISVIQRVVDNNSKSVFLAEVEIIDINTLECIQKLKTNGTGKWMTSLPIGEYNIILRKRDPITKAKVEVPQTIKVDGSTNPLTLPVMIVKQ